MTLASALETTSFLMNVGPDVHSFPTVCVSSAPGECTSYTHPEVISNEPLCTVEYEGIIISGCNGALTMTTTSLPIRYGVTNQYDRTFDWSVADITPTILPSSPPGHDHVCSHDF